MDRIAPLLRNPRLRDVVKVLLYDITDEASLGRVSVNNLI